MLVLVNGLFSGAEIALLSVRRTRVHELVEEGRGGAASIAALRDHPERLLATVQIGITVVGATAAAFGGSSIAGPLAEVLRPTVGHRADALALGLVIALVSYLSLVLGELVPKSLALRAAEPYALLVAPSLSALAWVARPLVWLLTASSNAVLRVFGDRTSFTETRHSLEELQQLVDEAASAGTVDPHVGEIASRALEFDELDVSVLMVPRREIVALHHDATVDALADLTRRGGPSRVLVHEGDLDHTVGYVHAREVLARARVEPELRLADAIHPVPFLPDTLSAPAALRQLQAQHVPLGVIVDEQGTVRGLVAIEDLVEELVGEILTEDEAEPGRIRRDPDGSVHVLGSTPVHEVNRELDIELPEPETAATIGGLCIEQTGAIPPIGTRIPVAGWTLEVAEATHRRVKAVRLIPA